ncbi:MAG TPA: FHA domain-containing protein [Streptosporangiaceae bacterium]|nr:FHA domain-containing protein [Streptosporangiaceae bacterium]
MSEYGVLPGLWPIHGDGVLARQGDLVLLVHPAGGPFTDRLLDLLARAARAGESGRRFADLICAEYEADAASAAGNEEGPAAVAFGPVGGGTAVAVYGTAWAEVTTARGVQQLATGEPYGRLLCVLPSTVVKVRAGVRPVSSVGDTDPYLRLADGVVRAVALVYAPAEVPPDTGHSAGQAAPPAHEPTPAPAEPAAVAEAAAMVEAADEVQAAVEAQSAYQAEADAQAQAQAADQAMSAPVPVPVGPGGSWRDQAPGPAPADAGSADQDVHSPTSLDRSWHEQAAPKPAPVDAGLADPAAVHSPTSLDVAWRDQAPGPAPADAGFGNQGAQWGAGQQEAGDQYGQGQYQYGQDQYGQDQFQYGAGQQAVADPPDGDFGRDFVALSLLGGQAPDDMPRRDPLPLGAEPLDDKALGPAEGPAPVVLGIYCKSGHFNDPEARYCAVCGIGMAQLTKIPQEGKRPPLGVLILDDGSVCQLDTDYVMGREPTLDKSVADGRARPLRLGGASDLVSRIHARVELDGWQVYVSDLNSANGTFVALPGESAATKLAPGVRTPLVAGAQIRLGDAYGLRYDSHRHR